MKLIKKFIFIVLLSLSFNATFALYKKKSEHWNRESAVLKYRMYFNGEPDPDGLISPAVNDCIHSMIQESKENTRNTCMLCKKTVANLRSHIISQIIKPAWCKYCFIGLDSKALIEEKKHAFCPVSPDKHHHIERRIISAEEIAILKKLYADASNNTEAIDHKIDIRNYPIYKTMKENPISNKNSIAYICNSFLSPLC